MFIEADKISDDARIWIYQADRELTGGEINQINALAQAFVEEWTAHNRELKASFEIRYKLFLIFYVDEKHASASGCSIDKSVHFIQKIEKDFSVGLTNRQIFAVRMDGVIKLIGRKDFENLIIESKVDENTIVFNNLIQHKRELASNWEIRMGDSWHSAIRII